MAELEEEKRQQPIVEYNPPMPNYQQIYGPELSQYENYMQLLQSKVDPAVQEKQDRQLATGRAFWAGANMLGNVISNIMNVNAVKAGAPSADTYNGEAFNQMYNLWKDADTRLRTERKIAQDRYDAAALGLARLKGSIAEKEAAHATNVYNINNQREAAAQAEQVRQDNYMDRLEKRGQNSIDRIGAQGEETRKNIETRAGSKPTNAKSYKLTLGGYTTDAGGPEGMAYILGRVQAKVVNALKRSSAFTNAQWDEKQKVKDIVAAGNLKPQKLQELIDKYDLKSVDGFDEALADIMGQVYVGPEHKSKKTSVNNKAQGVANTITKKGKKDPNSIFD